MGHVAMETRNEGRGLREWYYLCLGETRTLDQLIRNRYRLDGTFYATRDEYTFAIIDLPELLDPVFLTYVDLDRLIDESDLTERQANILHMLMQGYTLTDIAGMNHDIKSIHAHYIAALRKLSRQNQLTWENSISHRLVNHSTI